MRNASKNTIKKVMRKAEFDQHKYSAHFNVGNESDYNYYSRYRLFNEVGAQIYRMSKGKICNRSLDGVDKYTKYVPSWP